MADDQQELTRVNWNEVFAVTHVFKSFQMARQLGKLALALAAVLLIWLWGWALDLAWPSAYSDVPDGEIYAHASLAEKPFADWRQQREGERPGKVDELYQAALNLRKGGAKKLDNPFRVYLQKQDGLGGYFETALFGKLDSNEPESEDLGAATDWRAALAKVEKLIEEEETRLEELIDEAKEAAAESIENDAKGEGAALDAEKKEEAESKLQADSAAARRALTRMKIGLAQRVVEIRGRAISAALADYERHCFRNAIAAVLRGNITGGLAAYRKMLDDRSTLLERPAPAPFPSAGAAGPTAGLSPAPADGPPGFLYWCLMGLHGFGWLGCQHWVYAIIFLAVALGIWALFGGAMHRMSALHFARDEKISVTQALKFSASKFLSFYTAPLIPLAIIVVIGLFMMLGGLALSVPVLDVIMSILFPLALLGGLLIAFLVIGLAAGGALMYPTIAVESSDSFDAISRSYSYVFGRPWRAGFYGLVALVYGVICYLFVRLFAFLLLAAAHGFVGAGVWGGGEAISPAADKLDAMWPVPTFDNLLPPWQWEALSGLEVFCAGIIWIMVMPIAALVLAFLLSYVSSASTAIYFLLRQKVDATDLDDVYVEEPEEEPLPGETPAEPAAEPAPEPAPEPAEEPAEEETPAKPKRTRKKAAKKAKKKAKKTEKESDEEEPSE